MKRKIKGKQSDLNIPIFFKFRLFKYIGDNIFLKIFVRFKFKLVKDIKIV